MLLSEVSQFTKFVETKFLYDSWKKCSGNKDDCSSSTDLSGAPLVQIMEVVGNQAAHISKIAVDDIKSKLRPGVIVTMSPQGDGFGGTN